MVLAALLDDAARLVHDPARCIEPALAAWRHAPLPALTALIEELADRLPPPAPLQRRKLWRLGAASLDTAKVPALIAGLQQPWGPTEAEALLRWPGDPRILLALANLLPTIPVPARTTVLVHLLQSGDARLIPLLENGHSVVELQRRVDAIALAPADAMALERLLARRAAHLAAERALIDEVCAAPDDDGPRLVFGDWLQGHGDPRGELIALQFRRHRGKISQQERDRERQLLRVYREVWLGDLAGGWVNPTGFERGFAADVELIRWSPHLVACTDWAMARSLDIKAMSWGPQIDELFAGRLPRIGRGLRTVRTIRRMGYELITRLAARGVQLPVTTLEVVTSGTPGDGDELSRVFPAVEVLEVSYTPPWLPGARLLPRLRRLVLHASNPDPAVLRAVFAGATGLEDATVIHNGVELRLRPGQGRLVIHCDAYHGWLRLDGLAAIIRLLPIRVDELVVTGDQPEVLIPRIAPGLAAAGLPAPQRG